MKLVKCDCCGNEIAGRMFTFDVGIENEYGDIINEPEVDDEWLGLKGTIEDKDYCFECAKAISKMICGEKQIIPKRKSKITNVERIRSMTDDELAVFLTTFKNPFGEEYEGEKSCLDWLKESED